MLIDDKIGNTSILYLIRAIDEYNDIKPLLDETLGFDTGQIDIDEPGVFQIPETAKVVAPSNEFGQNVENALGMLQMVQIDDVPALEIIGPNVVVPIAETHEEERALAIKLYRQNRIAAQVANSKIAKISIFDYLFTWYSQTMGFCQECKQEVFGHKLIPFVDNLEKFISPTLPSIKPTDLPYSADEFVPCKVHPKARVPGCRNMVPAKYLFAINLNEGIPVAQFKTFTAHTIFGPIQYMPIGYIGHFKGYFYANLVVKDGKTRIVINNHAHLREDNSKRAVIVLYKTIDPHVDNVEGRRARD